MPNGLCLSDYVLPAKGSGRDPIALLVVTAGEGIRQRSEEAKASGRFFEAHALQALAIETAEGRDRMASPPHPGGLGLP